MDPGSGAYREDVEVRHTGKTERKLVLKVLRPLAYCLPTLANRSPPEPSPAAFNDRLPTLADCLPISCLILPPISN